jgi:hypothetical protein
MRNLGLLTALAAMALLPPPALAEPAKSDEPEKPLLEKDLTAKDVVATPATDLNLKKDEIPALLTAAQERPYTLRGIATCQQIGAAIVQLDAVLGEDIDLPRENRRRMQPGRVAQSVVGAFIPFRGVIREVSGASAHDRAMQAAVLAGVARRAFLKGIGQGKGCRYPARSATLEVFNQRMAVLNGAPEKPLPGPADAEPPTPAREREASAASSGVSYVSRPMVQRVN